MTTLGLEGARHSDIFVVLKPIGNLLNFKKLVSFFVTIAHATIAIMVFTILRFHYCEFCYTEVLLYLK